MFNEDLNIPRAERRNTRTIKKKKNISKLSFSHTAQNDDWILRDYNIYIQFKVNSLFLFFKYLLQCCTRHL